MILGMPWFRMMRSLVSTTQENNMFSEFVPELLIVASSYMIFGIRDKETMVRFALES